MRYVVLLLVLLQLCQSASDCVPKTVAKCRYGICAPTQWHADVDEKRGTVFLCSEKHGRCSELRGGHPLPGKAFMEIVTRDCARNRRKLENLRDWVSEVVRGSEPASIADIQLTGAKSGTLRVSEVRQFEKFSHDPGTGTWTYYYFVRLEGRALLVTLTFMESDDKSEYYRQVVLDTIKTLWVKPLPDGN